MVFGAQKSIWIIKSPKIFIKNTNSSYPLSKITKTETRQEKEWKIMQIQSVINLNYLIYKYKTPDTPAWWSFEVSALN